jgi:hypothetical protein
MILLIATIQELFSSTFDNMQMMFGANAKAAED